MQATLAPHLAQRAAPAILAALVHVGLAAALVMVPAVRERIFEPPPLVVSLVEPPRTQVVAPAPPKPVLRDAPQVNVAPPPIAIQPEIAIAPPLDPRPTITGPVMPPPSAPAPQLAMATEPPRFDMAYLRNPPRPIRAPRGACASRAACC